MNNCLGKELEPNLFSLTRSVCTSLSLHFGCDCECRLPAGSASGVAVDVVSQATDMLFNGHLTEEQKGLYDSSCTVTIHSLCLQLPQANT